MIIFAKLLVVIGITAGITAFLTGGYVVVYGWQYANPRDHRNPDWMAILLRLYKRQIIAYFLLLATCFATLLLASYIGTHWSS